MLVEQHAVTAMKACDRVMLLRLGGLVMPQNGRSFTGEELSDAYLGS